MTEAGRLHSDTSSMLETECPEIDRIHHEIRSLVLQEDYPCVAAIRSVVRNDYLVGVYGQFGHGTHWQKLRTDLLQYIELQRTTQSRYVSFWAVFSPDDKTADSAIDFEANLWRELSWLSSEEERASDWGKMNSSDPNDPSFCISLHGEKLFVVGLHPQSPRIARRFSRPAMVFNAFSQFEQYVKDGTYTALVNTIRQRDVKFQGSINPMVLAHGDAWESIQYSGQENPDSWKCPFHFMKQQNKPL